MPYRSASAASSSVIDRCAAGRGRLAGVVADEAADLREALTAAGRIGLHRPGDAAGTPLPHRAEGVDEEVVGDVRPALLRTGVERVEAAQHLGDVAGGVPVGRRTVVDDEETDVARRLLRQPIGHRQPRGPVRARPHGHAAQRGWRGDGPAGRERRQREGERGDRAPEQERTPARRVAHLFIMRDPGISTPTADRAASCRPSASRRRCPRNRPSRRRPAPGPRRARSRPRRSACRRASAAASRSSRPG